jgi:hypothetical protein
MKRRPVLALLLMVVSSSAAAEWIRVTELEAGSVYVDPATIRRDGDWVKMGTLIELKTAFVSKTNGRPYQSQKLQGEFDCEKEQWRQSSVSWYSGNMGEGKMVEYISDSYKWEPIRAGSAVEVLRQFACSKK